MPIKITLLGAGSIGFTRRLMQDLLAVPELQDTTFSLMDIDSRNLKMVEQLCRRDIQANQLTAKIETSTDARKAITDADYIICMIRQGGLRAFQADIDIPLRYGVDQCVGDTLGPGGLLYAQRTIPVLLEFCRHIREVAKPNALFLNYANPMAMNTWACNQYGGVKTIGLCHGVQGAHGQITQCIEIWAKKKGLLAEDVTLHSRDVDVIAAGINHQTWFTHVQWQGHNMVPFLLELFENHPVYQRTEKVRIDVLRRFGYYSTESNGHLSEYLPWYRKRTREIKKWIDLSSWIHGETGGYLRVCTEGRNWFEKDFPNWLKAEPPVISQENRSVEHGSYIIEALETGRIYRGHFNVVNQGHITNLPDGCVIEIPGYVDANGINMPVFGDLPLACAATCSASVRVQQMGVEAAVKGNLQILKQAVLHDPLTAAVCNPEEVWQMTDEMVVAHSEWLPQYATDVPAAKERLKRHETEGTRVRLKTTTGAARIKTRTVKTLSRNKSEARANASAADKGKLVRRS
jgi:alpha-galactosidase